MRRITLLPVLAVLALLFLSPAPVCAAEDPAAVTREIQRATHFVTLFEKELDQQRGGLAERYFNKTEATNRVRSLHERYPDDPRVQALFERVRAAVMRSKGDYITITPEMLAYRDQEKRLQQTLGKLADEKWQELLEQAKVEARTVADRRAGDKAKIVQESEKSSQEEADKTTVPDEAIPQGETSSPVTLAQISSGPFAPAEVSEPVYDQVITTSFPTPDWERVSMSSLQDALIVLAGVLYPQSQFMGTTGEYLAVGKPSSGYWYVKIDSRNWVGPWEAVKRCRREAVSSLEDVTEWTILGRITDFVFEIPQAEEKKTMTPQAGWVVTPLAIHAPGLVTAWYDPKAETSGQFAGEENFKEIKEGFYTIKSVSDDASPEQVMEAFVTAIKEKNRDLYVALVNPERVATPIGRDLVGNYHWDLHQHRFKTEYVAVTFGKPRIVVAKGFDEKDDDYFLTDEQKGVARKIGGQKLEFAYIDCKAWDENGRQYGTPKQYQLVRKNGSPWRIETYATPF